MRWLLACMALVIATSMVEAENRFDIGSAEAENLGDIVEIDLALEADGELQSFSLVFQYDGRKVRSAELQLSEDLDVADIVETRIERDYMVITVLVDVDGEGAASFPPGPLNIGTARVQCICEGQQQEVIMALPHRSKHSLIPGGQIVNNMLVIDGEAIRIENGLILNNGMVVCNGEGGGVESPVASCGDRDEMGDLIDAKAAPGSNVNICYFYTAPITEDPTERIQGLQISSGFDCNLTCIEDSVSIVGTVLEEVNADFLSVHCDNDPEDGDLCELIAGMLIDAAAPVDGGTLPGTDIFRSLFCLDFTVSPDAKCGSSLGIDFIDGLNGRGVVPINNIVSINNFDFPLDSIACAVSVEGTTGDGEFIRGDCNFNDRVNVADAAAIISHLFLEGAAGFEPPCLKACDADDTGKVNVMDTLYLLSYLFIVGSPAPPPPGGLVPGPDPTPDDLTCEANDGECGAP